MLCFGGEQMKSCAGPRTLGFGLLGGFSRWICCGFLLFSAFTNNCKEGCPMMIDRSELEELAGYQNTRNPVVSLYLNITPPRNYENELNSLIHTTMRAVERNGRYTDQQVKELEKLTQKIEDYAQKEFKRLEGTRLVVLFADADGLWREYHLPVALAGSMVVDFDPY